MKRLHILMLGLFAALFAISAKAQDQGIRFHEGNWSSALASAKAQDKLVFVDCYTDWCGPCKWMAAKVMTEPEVGKLFNENFINVGIDMEKGEGPELAKTYAVNAYPTLLFVDGDGNLVTKTVGAKPVPEFLAMGQEVLDGVEPLGKLQAQFATGEYDRKWLYEYLARLSESGTYDSLATEEFRQYMAGEGLLAEDSWDIFMRIYRRADTPEFQFVRDNLDRFEEKFGRETVHKKLAENYSGAMWSAAQQKDFEEYKTLRKGLSSLELDDLEALLGRLDLIKFKLELEPKAYRKKAAQIADKYLQDDAMLLNNLAWEFYESEHDLKMLERALKWAERSIEIEKDYANMDTYGFLLFKTGQKAKAQKVLAEAIEIAKAKGEDYSATENDLQEWLERLE